MNFYALSALINALVASLFSFLIYFKDKRETLNRIFSLVCFSVAVWSWGYFFWQTSSSYSVALFWVKVLMLGAIFIPITYLHFLFAWLDLLKKKFKIIFAGYFLSVVFLLFDLYSDLLVKGLEKRMYFLYWPVPGAIFHPFLALWILTAAYSVLILFKAIKNSSGLRRFQLKYIFIGTLIGYVGGATNYFLWYNVKIPPFGNISAALYLSIIAYVMVRYRLMDIKFAFGKGLVYLLSFVSVLILGQFIFNHIHVYFPNISSFEIKFGLALAFSLYFYHIFLKFFSWIGSKYFYYSYYSFQKAITDFAYRASSILDIEKLSEEVLTTIFDILKVKRGMVLIRNPERGVLKIVKSIGFAKDKGENFANDDFLIEWLGKEKKPLVYSEIDLLLRDINDKQEKKFLDELKEKMIELKAELCLPLIVRNELVGVIILGGKALEEPFSEQDINLLTTFTFQLGTIFENARLYSQLKELSDNLQEKVEKQTKDLKNLLKAKDEFLHIVSHQLRTPLTVLRGYLHLWASEGIKKFSAKKQKEIKNMIFVSAERLHKIIKDMLEVVDLEGGRMQMKFSWVNVKDLINEIYEASLKPEYEKKNLFFCLNSSLKEPFLIRSDPRFLEVVFQNVLDNARKYTFSGGVKVDLSLERSDRVWLVVKIKDTGMGFSQEDKKRLFRKFMRGDRAKNIDPNGTGLGLYISKKIIENLGGKFIIESEGINKGTKVIIKLPINKLL